MVMKKASMVGIIIKWFSWLRGGFHGLNDYMKVFMFGMVMKSVQWFEWL